MITAHLFQEASYGNPRAEKEIFDLTYRNLFSTAIRYLKIEEDAEESVMSAFIKFFISLKDFQYLNEAATMAFLKKCLINECLMQLRKKRSFQIISMSETKDEVVNEAALNNLSTNQLLQTIAELPIGYRTVFNLYEIEGYQHREIAALLDITEGTSKSQLYKAKQLLQKNIISKQSYYAKQG